MELLKAAVPQFLICPESNPYLEPNRQDYKMTVRHEHRAVTALATPWHLAATRPDNALSARS